MHPKFQNAFIYLLLNCFNENLILLAAASSSVDPWGMPVQQQTQPPQQQLDPWGASAGASAAPAVTSDPWSPVKEPPRVSPLPNLGPAPTSKIFKNYFYLDVILLEF